MPPTIFSIPTDLPQFSAYLQGLHSDGQRFLLLGEVPRERNPAANTPRQLILVTHWFTALRARLGGGER